VSAPEGLCQGQVPYQARHDAKRAAWAEVDATGRGDLVPVTYRCPRDPSHIHYELQEPEQVAARLTAKGVEVTPENLLPAPRRRTGEPPPWTACPSCGSGWGRPHYERCLIDVPAYTRPITQYEARVITTFAISIFPLDVMRRSTIRAMLPRGDDLPRKSGTNRMSVWFGGALNWAAEYGYISQDPSFITVLRRKPMVAFAGRRMNAIPGLVEQVWLAIAAVAADLPEQHTAAGQAQRERELDALRKLMQAAPGGGHPGGRGSARIVPAVKPL
jgi:hypothetical protein